MPAQGVSMHKIREILRLHFDSKLSQHQIAASLKISSEVVNKYVCLAKAASLSWPVEPLDDKSLRALLRPYKESIKQSPLVEPDYSSIHQKKGLDQQPLKPSEPSTSSVLKHENIRGASHYQS